ncbi:single-stranded-DNA-specific exonuclease RecJ [Candidatus Woesebacteria bacterium RBG_13_36_22]|uniref:Single-stranded-DNA-specific exonuclease RecJ n=1 Tax=Candidatus Woesebacteria bacterium RBG_13_36_22 TaxID=1802478 RepID=A0A1F7X397_9BACT|nr:MAG: single-stranded-DNA-specific exonuclease RecJ [Candidatus Woesebacteria bacterium RBG_13_36_22]
MGYLKLMKNLDLKWEVLNKAKSQKPKAQISDILRILLENRGLKTKKQKIEFLNPKHPEKLDIKELGIDSDELKKALKRIKEANKNEEQIIIYGDYDADGICATAILWETLFSQNENVKPYIPDRFEEGYGINTQSVESLKKQNPNIKLIITVDNGIVASDAIESAGKLGIDVIITDHHQKGKKIPKAYSVLHTDKISGTGIAWILAREITKKIQNPHLRRGFGEQAKFKIQIENNLELVAIGTIADQMPLLGPNRSFTKYGLRILNKTKRLGLKALFSEAGLVTFKGPTLQGVKIGTYEVNFIIAPRLNAMGRMEHAIDSLRLLCTKNQGRAQELAGILGRTNKKRQKIVDEVVLHARHTIQNGLLRSAIVLAHETYHEGVIGLAASKLVEEFWRPAIVFSKGDKISKASARSLPGFNIIESIRSLDDLILGGGGHPMAAGFSIETSKIEIFRRRFEELTASLLTDEILSRKLRIDAEIGFESLGLDLINELENFEPSGIGNPTPVFATNDVNLLDTRTVGVEAKHLKLTLEKNGLEFGAIAFGKGDLFTKLKPESKVDIAFNLSRDVWNGNSKLQLKIKDIKIA